MSSVIRIMIINSVLKRTLLLLEKVKGSALSERSFTEITLGNMTDSTIVLIWESFINKINNGRFVKNNKHIKDIINLINNFFIIKSEVNEITVVLADLKSSLFLSL